MSSCFEHRPRIHSKTSILYNKAVGFKEIYSMDLLVASCTEATFELLDRSIWAALDLEGPSGW
jgi:hypothetical protein